MAVMGSGTALLTLPTDEQILITREFDAPKHLVFKAWTTPELVKRWWHANRGVVTVAEIDLRVGGTWRYVAVADDGLRSRLPRRIPRDRPQRADRFNRDLRGPARRRVRRGSGDRKHRDVHRGERAHNAHPPRAGQEQDSPRCDHRLRDGGRPAGCAGPPRADRDLASLIRQATRDHRDDLVLLQASLRSRSLDR
jgi:hypothetical protein